MARVYRTRKRGVSKEDHKRRRVFVLNINLRQRSHSTHCAGTKRLLIYAYAPLMLCIYATLSRFVCPHHKASHYISVYSVNYLLQPIIIYVNISEPYFTLYHYFSFDHIVKVLRYLWVTYAWCIVINTSNCRIGS
jgi:hypothetical protein